MINVEKLLEIVNSFEYPANVIMRLRYVDFKTQQEVSEELGIDVRFISRIEKVSLEQAKGKMDEIWDIT